MSELHIPSRNFAISVVPTDEHAVVLPVGEIDLASAGEVAEEVRSLKETDFQEIEIDLRGVEFLDSVGLRMLLSLREDAERAGYQLVLRPGPDAVQRVFDLTGTRRVFAWR